MIVSKIGDVLGKHETAEIRCLYQGTIARKLKRLPDNMVEIEALTWFLVVSADTPVKYEPWVMDRGNMLFDPPNYPSVKLCGEADSVCYPDGTQESVEPVR